MTSSSYSSLNYVNAAEQLLFLEGQKSQQRLEVIHLSFEVPWLATIPTILILIPIPYSLSWAIPLAVALRLCLLLVIKTLAKCRPHHYRFCFKLPLQPAAQKRHARR